MTNDDGGGERKRGSGGEEWGVARRKNDREMNEMCVSGEGGRKGRKHDDVKRRGGFIQHAPVQTSG